MFRSRNINGLASSRPPSCGSRARAPLSQRQIRERAATRHKTVGAILQRLVREGRIERNAEGGYSVVAGATDKAAPVDAANGSRPPQAPRFPNPGSANV